MKLGDVAEFANGLNYGQRQSGHAVRVLGVGDFQDNSLTTLDEVSTVFLDRPLRATELLQRGDLVFVRSNGNRKLIGRCLFIEAANEPATHSGFTIRARINSPKVLPEFVNLWVRTPLAKRQIQTAGGGTNISNLNQRILANLRLPLPSLEVQEAILDATATWDRAIDQAERLFAAKERRRRALAQQLLTGKRRFPGFEHPWQEYRLADVFVERVEVNRLDLRLLSITADRGVIDRSEVERKDTSNADKARYKRIAPGDIGYNTMRMWQGVSALSEMEGIISPAYTVVTPKPIILGEFGAHLFKSAEMIHLFYRHSQGLVDDTRNLKFSHFSRIRVTLPPLDEQKRIAALLTNCDDELKDLQSQIERIRRQKTGLMHRLLTGELRVAIHEGTIINEA